MLVIVKNWKGVSAAFEFKNAEAVMEYAKGLGQLNGGPFFECSTEYWTRVINAGNCEIVYMENPEAAEEALEILLKLKR